MSFANVLKRIRALVEEAKPATSLVGGDRFRFDARGQTGESVGPRRFWFRVVEGAGIGPASLSINRADVVVDLVVDYPTSENAGRVDETIVDDWRVIHSAINTPAKWDRETSGIIHVGHGDPEKLYPYVVEDLPGLRRLRVRFNVMWKVVTP